MNDLAQAVGDRPFFWARIPWYTENGDQVGLLCWRGGIGMCHLSPVKENR